MDEWTYSKKSRVQKWADIISKQYFIQKCKKNYIYVDSVCSLMFKTSNWTQEKNYCPRTETEPNELHGIKSVEKQGDLWWSPFTLSDILMFRVSFT